MSTDSSEFVFPLSQTSAFPERSPSKLPATRIWYADCFQFRSPLSLCHDRCGALASMPNGFSRYWQRKRTGAEKALAAVPRTTTHIINDFGGFKRFSCEPRSTLSERQADP